MAVRERSLAVRCFAEALGTFLLVFFGCGAVHVAILTGALAGLGQVAFVWAVAITAAIYIVGAVSGAHINPAITVALSVWGLFPKGRVPAYVAAQFAGAFLGACVLYGLFAPQLARTETDKGVEIGRAHV